MKFECKEISISDDVFGCTVSLSENEENHDYEKELTVDEVMKSIGQYIMLQRTYPEDEFEEDYYYFESSDFDKSCELNEFEITLTPTEFVLTIEKDRYEIEINPSAQILDELIAALKKITDKNGKLSIQD